MNPETEAIDIPGDDAINAFVRPNWERKQAEKEAAGKGTAEPYASPRHRTCAKFFTAPKGNARLYITAKGLYGGLRKRQRETGRFAPSDRESPNLAVPAGGTAAA